MNRRKQVRGLRGWCVVVCAVVVVVLAGCDGYSATPAASLGKVDTVLKMPNLKGQTIVVNTSAGTFADAFRKAVVAPVEAATGTKVTLTTNCCDALSTQIKGHHFAGDVVVGQYYAPGQAW